MKETGLGNQSGSRRKVYHCKNCGRIQSYTNFECEGCGIDLGLYGKVEFVGGNDFLDLTENRRKEEIHRLREKEEAKKRAEEEMERLRREKLQQEEANRKIEQERRQAQLRAEAEAKEKAEQERVRAQELKKERQQAEEKRKAAEARRKAEEAARRKAEEERHIAEQQRAAQAKKKADEERDQTHRNQKNGRERELNKRSEKKFFSRLVGVISTSVVCGLLLTLVLMFIGLKANVCGDGLKWEFDAETATLTIEGAGTMDNFAFAKDSGRMDHFPDLEEAPWMEAYRNAIQHVVIEPGAENIGACAFADCENLQDITIPDTVKSIGQLSLSNTNLVTVTIPKSVEIIENATFGNNPKLRNLIFAGNTPILNNNILQNEDERLVIVGNDPVAEEYARSRQIIYVQGSDIGSNGDFGGASDDGNLRWNINLYNRILTISGSGPMEDFNGKWMLDNVENKESWVEGRNLPYWTEYAIIVEKLVVEEGITRIGDSAFEQCHNMLKATLPNSLEYIGFQSFLSAGLVRITVPEGVTHIHDHAFNFCEHLQFVELPESLELLQNGTFNMCNVLHSLRIGGNTEIERRTGKDGCFGIFSNDHNPKGRPAKLVILGKYGSDAQKYAQEEKFTFNGNGLKAGMKDSGECGDNVWWTFEGDERTLYITGQGSTWSYFITQKDIDDWAEDIYRRKQTREGAPDFLMYATFIEHIVVKNGVKVLGHGLFSSHDDPLLRNLKTVDFGSVKHIQANLKRTQLEYVDFPASVTGIDGCALADNDYLKTVVIRNGSAWIGTGLLYHCNRLERVELHGKEKIDDYNDGDLFNNPGDLPKWYLPGYLRLYVKHDSEGEQMAREKGIPYEYLD